MAPALNEMTIVVNGFRAAASRDARTALPHRLHTLSLICDILL